jgi:F420-0:gamma-glutamyl ligase
MNIIPIQTSIISAGSSSIYELLDLALSDFQEGSILAVTSKIVALCESNVVAIGSVDKEALVKQESQYYLAPENSPHRHHFTIANDTLISMAGIDESNAGGVYALWPRDVQKSANDLRDYLRTRFGLQHVGAIIVDSTSQPLRRGVAGICLAHSGFKALNDYRGKEDLFGRKMKVEVANISGGLAAAAVVVMGEGAEQTPLAVISDIPFVTFQDAHPTVEELSELRVTLEDDLFAPFLKAAPWDAGGHSPTL